MSVCTSIQDSQILIILFINHNICLKIENYTPTAFMVIRVIYKMSSNMNNSNDDTSNILCQDGMGCDKRKCLNEHPPNWNWMQNVMCRESEVCANPKCGFGHPEGWNWMKNVKCRDSNGCPNPKCGFGHPLEWNWMTNVKCRTGNNCSNHKCGFGHPEGWDFRTNVECRFKSGCKNKANCQFKHPAPQGPKLGTWAAVAAGGGGDTA
jgi:hypothetical protein